MKHILAWHDGHRGDCLIEIWSDGKVWHWFYRDSEILRYQQDIYYGSIFSLKRRLRERFYPPRSLKFCLTKRAPDSLTAGEISQPEIVVVENALPAVSG